MHTQEFDNIIYIEDNSTYYKRKFWKMFRYMVLIGFGYCLALAHGFIPNCLNKIESVINGISQEILVSKPK